VGEKERTGRGIRGMDGSVEEYAGRMGERLG